VRTARAPFETRWVRARERRPGRIRYAAPSGLPPCALRALPRDRVQAGYTNFGFLSGPSLILCDTGANRRCQDRHRMCCPCGDRWRGFAAKGPPPDRRPWRMAAGARAAGASRANPVASYVTGSIAARDGHPRLIQRAEGQAGQVREAADPRVRSIMLSTSSDGPRSAFPCVAAVPRPRSRGPHSAAGVRRLIPHPLVGSCAR
jgi:hypothetical protein